MSSAEARRGGGKAAGSVSTCSAITARARGRKGKKGGKKKPLCNQKSPVQESDLVRIEDGDISGGGREEREGEGPSFSHHR